jgi:hypothetical protein
VKYPSGEPQWVTVQEAAHRLGMSGAGSARSRTTSRSPSPAAAIGAVSTGQPSRGTSPGPGSPGWTRACSGTASGLARGVVLLDRVTARFGWSDRQLSRALGVTPAVVSHYRRSGVPDHGASRLRRLSRLPVEGAVASPPRRRQ